MADRGSGPSAEGPPLTTATSIDVDPRSAIPLSVAFAVLAVTVWLIRSVPRTITAAAIATLLALALNPLVESLQRRTGWQRRYAAGTVLCVAGIVFALVIALVTVPTIQQVRSINDDIPKTVQQLGDLPVVGPRLREADASRKVQEWLDELPERLSGDATPIANAAGTVADGVVAGLFTLLLAITLLLDGEHLVSSVRRLVPHRRRDQADRLGRLVYEVLGRYIAGSLLVAILAATVILAASLVLSVPLAPLVAVWILICNPIPQVGGFLGAVPFVTLGFTRSALTGAICLVVYLTYQQIENHVLQPVIIGRAVSLTPPATMVAALVGVSAGGVVGGLFAVPLLGATKAIYMATRGQDLLEERKTSRRRRPGRRPARKAAKTAQKSGDKKA